MHFITLLFYKFTFLKQSEDVWIKFKILKLQYKIINEKCIWFYYECEKSTLWYWVIN